MKTTLSNIRKAVRAAVGGPVGRIEYGLRQGLSDRLSDLGLSDLEADVRRWAEDADLYDTIDIDTPASVTRLLKMASGAGLILDLYVYYPEGEPDFGDLNTNVTLAIDSNGEILACYDSVGSRGMEWDSWLMKAAV